MIYSCFDAATSTYRYFEDSSSRAVNKDMPIPRFPASSRTPIGISAVRAGRPLPMGAKPTGRGAEPRGIIVNCSSTSLGLGGLDDLSTNQKILVALGVAVVTGLVVRRLLPGAY